MERLRGTTPSDGSIVSKAKAHLGMMVLTPDGPPTPALQFFGPTELAGHISGKRFEPDDSLPQDPAFLLAYSTLKEKATWEVLMDAHAEATLRRSGRPLSAAWWSTARLAVSRAVQAGLELPEWVTKEQVRKLHASLDVGDTTKTKLLNSLSGLIQTGIEQDLLPSQSNPFRLVSYRAVTPMSGQRRAFTLDELGQLFEGPYGSWFKLLTFTGLRVGELLSRDPAEHLQGQMLVIGETKTWRPKTKSSYRRVPVPLELVPVMKELVPITVTGWTVSKWLQETVRAAFPEDRLVTPHSCRHSFMTFARAAGVPLDVTQEISGHSKASRTADGYGHYPDAVLIEAVEKVYQSVVDRGED